MKLTGMAGDHIRTVAQKAVDLVAGGEPSVSFEFNEIELTVKPGQSAGDICAEYDRLSEARRAAYVATPEYKERQRQAEEEGRRKREVFTAMLAKAPAAMSLKDPEGWAKQVAMNGDGYGSAVIRYAEMWARFMEAKIAEGATVAGCAKEMSHLADSEGIIGFMYGCAVSILATVWTHGEDLRRWHNKDVQFGTEGDKANETGGVLNPALISIGEKS